MQSTEAEQGECVLEWPEGQDPSTWGVLRLGQGMEELSRVDPRKALSQTHERQRACFGGCACALLVTDGVRSTCRGARRQPCTRRRRNRGSRAESQADEMCCCQETCCCHGW